MNQSITFHTVSQLPLSLAIYLFATSCPLQAVSPPPDGGYPNANTAEGDNALLNLTTGSNNTAVGSDALKHNTSGNENTAYGSNALSTNRTGSDNTAVGFNALFNDSSNGGDNGFFNTATGAYALFSNTTGADNTAMGFQALYHNTGGRANTAVGFNALFANTVGVDNTATGYLALASNTTGGSNTATGEQSLFNNSTGITNTAVGRLALLQNTTGNANIALGYQAGFKLTTGSDNIDIGHNGVAAESKTIRIGSNARQKNTFIAGIYGVTVPSGVGVVVDADGHLGTVTSSARFKEAIKPMDNASEAVLGLKPVTFRYKEEVDPDATPQFGLVAEEVEKVDPQLVVHDAQGKPFTVRYEAVNAMLLNEFLKEHRKVEELTSELQIQSEESQAKFAQQQQQIEALASRLQKVSDQVQASQPNLVAGN